LSRRSFNEAGTNDSQLLTFANDAVERDENATRRGKIDIERWASETIDKYKFHFKPLNVDRRANEREQRERASLARFVATFLLPVELLNSYLLLETRSLPTLARCYHRSFSFHAWHAVASAKAGRSSHSLHSYFRSCSVS
jgi:hypothetical protein